MQSHNNIMHNTKNNITTLPTNINKNITRRTSVAVPQPRSHSSTTQACAACKYQRRKCASDCILAPYFPHDRQLQFLNAHRLFGVSNIVKIVGNLKQPEKDHAMRTIIFESDARAADPVGGCYRIIRDLEQRINLAKAELDIVLHHLALCRAAAQQQLLAGPLDGGDHYDEKWSGQYAAEDEVVWCGMTEKAEELVKEEGEIIEKHSEKAAEYVTRMLMMAADNRLPLDKIAHFRRDLGLPIDFRKHWVHNYPENFKIVQPFKPYDEGEYLELVSWKPGWAITELEKTVLGIKEGQNYGDHIPRLLSLAFPLKFPSNYKKLYRFGGKIEHFQKREYLSPYADARGLQAGSLEFDKRAVAVMHELLSFTIEKRLVTDYLTHFRREFSMPQKLMRLLLKHFGIFYVSERGKRFSVFLNEAYDGSELIKKHPLVLWKEKVLSLVGYRGKKKKIESFEDFSELDEKALRGSDSEDDHVMLQDGQDETMHGLENASDTDRSEMEVEEVCKAYND